MLIRSHAGLNLLLRIIIIICKYIPVRPAYHNVLHMLYSRVVFKHSIHLICKLSGTKRSTDVNNPNSNLNNFKIKTVVACPSPSHHAGNWTQRVHVTVY